jgi:uncharacterized protein YjiS (DUF1127 family)
MSRVAFVASRAAAVPTNCADRLHPDVGYAQELLIRVFDLLGTVHDRMRQRFQLAALDERMLRDIGVDRATAASEAARPFWRV